MCADDSIYTFCTCLNAYTRRGAQVTFFFGAQTQEHRNHRNGDLEFDLLRNI